MSDISINGRHLSQEEARGIEWGGRSGCEGTSMGGPPMHMHITCKFCGAHEPEFNAKYPSCFRTAEDSIKMFGNDRSGVYTTHREDCPFHE